MLLHDINELPRFIKALARGDRYKIELAVFPQTDALKVGSL